MITVALLRLFNSRKMRSASRDVKGAHLICHKNADSPAAALPRFWIFAHHKNSKTGGIANAKLEKEQEFQKNRER